MGSVLQRLMVIFPVGVAMGIRHVMADFVALVLAAKAVNT